MGVPTPETIPAPVGIVVFIPDSPEYLEAFLGAILALTDANYWTQTLDGALVADIVQTWAELIMDTINENTDT